MHKIKKEQEANEGMSSDLLSRYCRAALNHSGKQACECTLTHVCTPTGSDKYYLCIIQAWADELGL